MTANIQEHSSRESLVPQSLKSSVFGEGRVPLCAVSFLSLYRSFDGCLSFQGKSKELEHLSTRHLNI